MRTLLAKKDRYYKEYADAVYKKARQMRFGIDSKQSVVNALMASIRKELVDWQSNEDEEALCQTNMTTWIPVNYRNDNLVQYDMTQNSWGPGYYNSQSFNGPAPTTGVGFAMGNSSGNIIEVNTGGCITRINLNPAITISQNSSFVFTQSTPSTTWIINHNMGVVPNVTTEDLQGNDIVGIIDVIDSNNIKIYFNQAVAGKAYLS